jgi:hypothetical protein
MFQFLLDLDELPKVVESSPLVSHNRFNAYSFWDRDHFERTDEPVREKLLRYLRDHGIEGEIGRVQLLTSLRTFGHVFNPVSYFFVADPAGEPLAVLAEVHNTFGERKPFLLTREDFGGDWFTASRLKHFYISPFSELDHQLVLRFRFPGEQLHLHVSDALPGERPFFHASMTGERRPFTTRQLLAFTLRFPFVTLKVVALIHWHALRLWLKGVPFHRKSDSPELQTDLIPSKSS